LTRTSPARRRRHSGPGPLSSITSRTGALPLVFSLNGADVRRRPRLLTGPAADVTSGLEFAGAPVGPSIAAIIDRDRRGHGLVHGNGGSATKQSFGVYSMNSASVSKIGSIASHDRSWPPSVRGDDPELLAARAGVARHGLNHYASAEPDDLGTPAQRLTGVRRYGSALPDIAAEVEVRWANVNGYNSHVASDGTTTARESSGVGTGRGASVHLRGRPSVVTAWSQNLWHRPTHARTSWTARRKKQLVRGRRGHGPTQGGTSLNGLESRWPQGCVGSIPPRALCSERDDV